MLMSSLPLICFLAHDKNRVIERCYVWTMLILMADPNPVAGMLYIMISLSIIQWQFILALDNVLSVSDDGVTVLFETGFVFSLFYLIIFWFPIACGIKLIAKRNQHHMQNSLLSRGEGGVSLVCPF